MALFKKSKIPEKEFPDRDDLVEIKENYAVGTIYECKKNPKKNRLNVLKKMKVGSPVDFEFYYYQHEPAYMLIDRKSGLDFGNLSQTVADSVFKHFPNATIVGRISEILEDTVIVRYEIYGEAYYDFISRSRVNVIYRCWKEGYLNANKELLTRAYALCDREDLTVSEADFVSVLRSVVQDCFDENYERANQRLSRIK